MWFHEQPQPKTKSIVPWKVSVVPFECLHLNGINILGGKVYWPKSFPVTQVCLVYCLLLCLVFHRYSNQQQSAFFPHCNSPLYFLQAPLPLWHPKWDWWEVKRISGLIPKSGLVITPEVSLCHCRQISYTCLSPLFLQRFRQGTCQA